MWWCHSLPLRFRWNSFVKSLPIGASFLDTQSRNDFSSPLPGNVCICLLKYRSTSLNKSQRYLFILFSSSAARYSHKTFSWLYSCSRFKCRQKLFAREFKKSIFFSSLCTFCHFKDVILLQCGKVMSLLNRLWNVNHQWFYVISDEILQSNYDDEENDKTWMKLWCEGISGWWKIIHYSKTFCSLRFLCWIN